MLWGVGAKMVDQSPYLIDELYHCYHFLCHTLRDIYAAGICLIKNRRLIFYRVSPLSSSSSFASYFACGKKKSFKVASNNFIDLLTSVKVV